MVGDYKKQCLLDTAGLLHIESHRKKKNIEVQFRQNIIMDMGDGHKILALAMDLSTVSC